MTIANVDLRLQSMAERIVRLETQRREMAIDIKDIKQEAKSAGYPPKAFALLLKELLETAEQRMTREEAETLKEHMKASLGDLLDTPLGAAAMERA